MTTLMTSSTKMTSDDPWTKIEGSTAKSHISARRIPGASSAAWGLYWGVDADNHCLLILERESKDRRFHRLPRLRGLSVEVSTKEDGTGERVVLRLTDGEQRELFLRFCVDVVEATHAAKSPEEAVERFLARTWRWHRLLQSGRDGRLSDDEQRGLIGELRVIERCLAGTTGAQQVVEGWAGPLGAPKDFQYGLVCIEAKACSPQSSEVRISSLHQLDLGSASRLFLSVTEVAAALEDSTEAITITDVATRVRTEIVRLDMPTAILFEDRLAALGFDWEDDYTDKHWAIGEEALYEVADGFPRITPTMLPPGVSDVRYTISLSDCEGFRVPTTNLNDAISGERDEP